ncbi:hypothetical protein [Sinosporangium siamense]|nr:hypothetical protein [Sinosporangium siamense]
MAMARGPPYSHRRRLRGGRHSHRRLPPNAIAVLEVAGLEVAGR